MFGSEILEVVIGVIFVFILVSVICSSVREGIEAILKSRAAYLEHGIRQLLHDSKAEGLVKSFYNHPLIFSLYSGEYQPRESFSRPSLLTSGRNLPSYIPSSNFALALMDIAARGPKTNSVSSDPSGPPVTLDAIRANVMNIPSEPVRRAVLAAIDSAQGDVSKVQATLEAWYDSSMDRVSGWYKRSTQWIIFLIGLTVAIVLNVDTITIADFLYRNDGVRAALVKQVELSSSANSNSNSSISYDKAREDLAGLKLPIGWPAPQFQEKKTAAAIVPGQALQNSGQLEVLHLMC
jgi:hypothetical protein